jgi:hypothetical protein
MAAERKRDRRTPVEIVRAAQEPLEQAAYAARYIRALREQIQELVNVCGDDAIEHLVRQGLLSKTNVEMRAEARAEGQTR